MTSFVCGNYLISRARVRRNPPTGKECGRKGKVSAGLSRKRCKKSQKKEEEEKEPLKTLEGGVRGKRPGRRQIETTAVRARESQGEMP